MHCVSLSSIISEHCWIFPEMVDQLIISWSDLTSPNRVSNNLYGLHGSQTDLEVKLNSFLIIISHVDDVMTTWWRHKWNFWFSNSRIKRIESYRHKWIRSRFLLKSNQFKVWKKRLLTSFLVTWPLPVRQKFSTHIRFGQPTISWSTLSWFLKMTPINS